MSFDVEGGDDEVAFHANLSGSAVLGTSPWRPVSITCEGPGSLELGSMGPDESAGGSGTIKMKVLFRQ